MPQVIPVTILSRRFNILSRIPFIAIPQMIFFCIFSFIASSILHIETATARSDILIRSRRSVLFSQLSNRWPKSLARNADAIADTQDVA